MQPKAGHTHLPHVQACSAGLAPACRLLPDAACGTCPALSCAACTVLPGTPALRRCVAGALPYLVAVDSAQGCVVLSLRGTLTLQDLVTDLVLEPVPLDAWLPPDFAKARRLLLCWQAPRLPAGMHMLPACEAWGSLPVLPWQAPQQPGDRRDRCWCCLACPWWGPRFHRQTPSAQEHGGKGPLLAHSGCVAAATAVLAALREDGTLFGILHELRVIAGHSRAGTPSHTPRTSNGGAAAEEPSTSGQAQVRVCALPSAELVVVLAASAAQCPGGRPGGRLVRQQWGLGHRQAPSALHAIPGRPRSPQALCQPSTPPL